VGQHKATTTTLSKKIPIAFDVNLCIVISFFGFGGLQLSQNNGPIQLGPFMAEHRVAYQGDLTGDMAECNIFVA
jgi:hypothetical protein